MAFGQILKTAAVPYTKGGSPYTPNTATSSEIRVDTSCSCVYWWDRDNLTWMRVRTGPDEITGSSAPAYTPHDNQSLFAVNDSSELYHYNGSSWVQIGGGGAGGIYGGSGNVPDGTIAALVDDFEFSGGDISSYTVTTGTTKGGQYFQNLSGATVIHRDTTGSTSLALSNTGALFSFGDGTTDRLIIGDRDARYSADYSGTYSARSLIDKGYADGAYLSDADWTTGFASGTQATSSWTATNAATNVNAAIVPKGSGALTLSVPDGTSTGGNARGTNAIDLQMSRSAATQVAGGTYSFTAGRRNTASGNGAIAMGGSTAGNTASGSNSIAIGVGNTSSGISSIAIGNSCTASADYAMAFNSGTTASALTSTAFGESTTASGKSSTAFGSLSVASLEYQIAYSAGRFATSGDAQGSILQVRRAITGTAQTELFIDGASIQAILPATNRLWNFRVDVVGVGQTVGNGTFTLGDMWSSWHCGAIKRLNTTTSIVGTVQTMATAQSDANFSTTVVTIDADDTTEALRIRITPPSTAGSTSVTRWVATITLTEVAY